MVDVVSLGLDSRKMECEYPPPPPKKNPKTYNSQLLQVSPRELVLTGAQELNRKSKDLLAGSCAAPGTPQLTRRLSICNILQHALSCRFWPPPSFLDKAFLRFSRHLKGRSSGAKLIECVGRGLCLCFGTGQTCAMRSRVCQS